MVNLSLLRVKGFKRGRLVASPGAVVEAAFSSNMFLVSSQSFLWSRPSAGEQVAWISAALQFVPTLLATPEESNQEPGDELESGWNSGWGTRCCDHKNGCEETNLFLSRKNIALSVARSQSTKMRWKRQRVLLLLLLLIIPNFCLVGWIEGGYMDRRFSVCRHGRWTGDCGRQGKPRRWGTEPSMGNQQGVWAVELLWVRVNRLESTALW